MTVTRNIDHIKVYREETVNIIRIFCSDCPDFVEYNDNGVRCKRCRV